MCPRSWEELVADANSGLTDDYEKSGLKGKVFPPYVEPTFKAATLLCPVCDDESIDRDGSGGDHTAVTTWPDMDNRYEANPLGTRGGYTEIAYRCASGHAFRLVIGNNKGIEYIGVEVLS